jgi:hypothetical protein
MELRNCAYSEPSHIHVPRPSRSETAPRHLDKHGVDEQRLLLTDTSEDAEDACYAR